MKSIILFVCLIGILVLPLTAAAEWSPLGWGTDGQVDALANYHGVLVAAGNFTEAGGHSTNNIAKWDGKTWGSLGSGLNGEVLTLAVYNGALIAGGRFTVAGGVPANRIASWDGSRWSPLGSGMQGDSTSYVATLTVFRGDLVAGGYFTTAGGVSVNHVAQWNGSVWSPLGSGLSGEWGTAWVWAASVYNDALIVGGYFTAAGGHSANSIAHWDGSTWGPLGLGITGINPYVSALTVYHGDLVAGGDFETVEWQYCEHIAKWDGTGWCSARRPTHNNWIAPRPACAGLGAANRKTSIPFGTT